jgi:predicted transcriptional regulator
MRSLRLDDRLDERVQRAAAVEGASVSEFIRLAVAERAERTLDAQRPSERLADVIGVVHSGGAGLAKNHSKVFGDLVAEKLARRRKA